MSKDASVGMAAADIPALPSRWQLARRPGHSPTDRQQPGPQAPFPSTTALAPEGQRTMTEVSHLCPPLVNRHDPRASVPTRLQIPKSLFVPLTAAPASRRPAAGAVQRIPHPKMNS